MQDVCTDAEMVALLENARRGVPAAYDRLYNLYADKLFRYLVVRVGQREIAEDLTADVFVRLLKVLPRFRINRERPVASFSAWLYRIADNLLTDHYHRQRHRQHQDIDDQVHLVSDLPSPYQHAAVGEKDRLLATTITKLVEEQQKVIIHRFAHQLNLQEVAQVMGKTEGAIKALQHRALVNLRRILRL